MYLGAFFSPEEICYPTKDNVTVYLFKMERNKYCFILLKGRGLLFDAVYNFSSIISYIFNPI